MRKSIFKLGLLFTFLWFTLIPFAMSNLQKSGFSSPISLSKNTDLSQSAWVNNGIPLCNTSHEQGRLIGITQMCSDGAGGAIATWTDVGASDYNISAQRIDENGTILWDLNGIAIANTTDSEYYQQIISDGFGGAIIVWEAYIGGSPDIYAQRIDSNGNKLWGSGVVVSAASTSQNSPRLCSDGNGGAIVTWQDDRTENPPLNAYDIYTQWINGTGSAKWTPNGVLICNATYGGNHINPEICSDGNGGAIITWKDNRTAGIDPDVYNIYAQKINSSGLTEWDANGTVICNADYLQENPKIISDGQGGAIISWKDDREDAGDYTVYAQRIDSDGNTLWENNGTCITPYTIHYSSQYMCSDGAGGAILAFRDHRYTGSGDLFAQRVDPNGNFLWGANCLLVCNVTEMQYPQGISCDGNGGAVVVWRDMRSGNYSNWDIYAQQIDSRGNFKWDENGTAICTEGSDQDYSTVIITTTGVAIFAWADNRSYSINDWDIYCYGKALISYGQQVNYVLLLAALAASQPGLLDQILAILLNPIVLGGIAIALVLIVIVALKKKK